MLPKVDHEYHIVEFNRYPDFEVFIWLHASFGAGGDVRWFYRYPQMYFQDPKDHLMFILKWSGGDTTKVNNANT